MNGWDRSIRLVTRDTISALSIYIDVNINNMEGRFFPI